MKRLICVIGLILVLPSTANAALPPCGPSDQDAFYAELAFGKDQVPVEVTAGEPVSQRVYVGWADATPGEQSFGALVSATDQPLRYPAAVTDTDPIGGSVQVPIVLEEGEQARLAASVPVARNGVKCRSTLFSSVISSVPPPTAEEYRQLVDVTKGKTRFVVDMRHSNDVCGVLEEFADERSECVADITLRQGGKSFGGTEISGGSDDSAGTYRYAFSCRRSGKVAYTIIVIRNDIRRATLTGSFRIPKCGKTLPRRVSNGVASAYANEVNQAAYETEFVSQIRCRPLKNIRGNRASTWRCQTVHNNNYRICVDTDDYSFTSRKVINGVDRGRSYKPRGRRCQNF